MNKPDPQDIIDFAGLDDDPAAVQTWIDDLSLMAADCLDTLDADKQKAALRYLVAHYLSAGAGMRITSEKLGDASWTAADDGSKGIRSTGYGRMAVQIAPCLEGLDASKRYTVRVV